MKSTLLCCVALITALMLMGCGSKKEQAEESAPDQAAEVKTEPADEKTSEPAEEKVSKREDEPDIITVQHILIAFQGSIPGKQVTRSREEAAALAADLLKRAQSGEDFDALVKEYTDDSHPGIYRMANTGVVAPSPNIFARGRMVPAFGDTGFPLAVGEIGMAAHDAQKSPYGWHIIKRIE